jgi:catalase
LPGAFASLSARYHNVPDREPGFRFELPRLLAADSASRTEDFMKIHQMLALLLLLGGAAAPTAPAADTLPRDLVDALNDIFGRHPGVRASHAKGVCAAGEFRAGPEAAALSRAPHFQGGTVPVTIRFSMGGGNPAISDKTATVRGMAVRFQPLGSGITDLVMISAPVFFARTPEQALEFLRVRRPDPQTGKADPERVAAFSKANPETTRQGAWVGANPLPDSYLSTPWFGVNAFRFTNAAGQSVYGRWHVLPDNGVTALDADELAGRSDDFLIEDLGNRLADGTASFSVRLQIAEEGDVITDPTETWPDDRRMVEVGKLTVTSAGGNCDGIMFSPLALPDGIEPSDDPILRIRTPVYAESFIRRQQGSP